MTKAIPTSNAFMAVSPGSVTSALWEICR